MSERTTLSELYIQIAKARAFEVIEEMIDAANGFRFDYGTMRDFLEALAFPHRAIPSEEEYRALIVGRDSKKELFLAACRAAAAVMMAMRLSRGIRFYAEMMPYAGEVGSDVLAAGNAIFGDAQKFPHPREGI